jgi:hypothetical protein
MPLAVMLPWLLGVAEVRLQVGISEEPVTVAVKVVGPELGATDLLVGLMVTVAVGGLGCEGPGHAARPNRKMKETADQIRDITGLILARVL